MDKQLLPDLGSKLINFSQIFVSIEYLNTLPVIIDNSHTFNQLWWGLIQALVLD